MLGSIGSLTLIWPLLRLLSRRIRTATGFERAIRVKDPEFRLEEAF